MADQESDQSDQIAKHAAGKADENELIARIGDAWRKVLGDPKERAAVAASLQVDEDKLSPDLPPFIAKVSGSGLTGGEVIIVFATAFTVAFAKDMGSAAGKAFAERLRRFWADYMQERVSPPGSGKLGDLKD
jgi:hypothetical protein